MSSFKTVPCKGCGRPIVWGVTEDGKRIPLDPRAPVYRVVGSGVVKAERMVHREAEDDVPLGYMCTHFATCSAAAQFSGSRPKEAKS